ncbi:hypothetical protein D3C78_988830 [compost metagenome]
MADRTSLAADTATDDGDVHVEFLDGFGQFQRLTNNHASGFTTEELVEAAVVDGDLASTRTQEDARGSSLTTAGAVVLSRRHNELSR